MEETMIVAEVATTMDRIERTPRSQRAAFLNAITYCSIAPWKYTALMKLHDLERASLPGSNARSTLVSSEAAMFARTMLNGLQIENVPNPTVCPASGGSVAIIWTVGLKQLEAIFGPDKSGSFVLSNGDEIVDDGEISVKESGSFSRAIEGILEA
jgi:hypothetical protein